MKYLDQTGFSLMLSLCYSWFRRGSGRQFEVPTRWGSKGRINLIGTLSLHGEHEQLEVRELEGSCNQAQVTAYLETLAQGCDPKRLTVVVLDNATFHKGQQINERRAAWEAKGLFLRYLPSYCPHLNLIERVWRKLKGFLMPRRCYDNLKQLLEGAYARLSYPQGVVLFSDGEAGYKTFFLQVFGTSYRPARKGSRGRLPKPRHHLSRRQAHVQVVKHRQGKRVVRVEVRYAHGSRKRVQRELVRLGYTTPNTSAIERRNGTARSMDACMVRKTLAFARTPETREARGSWGVMVYNWGRENRALQQALPEPMGKRKYERRSPAMAAGLTDHIWSIQELLLCPTYPKQGKE